MTYEPLHHKYRPQTFADLVGQEAIATTLTNALLSERIAPAYLFTGPRGTGKTSSARILAKSLNCIAGNKPTPTPCGQCEICRAIARGNALDVIEIDAASNTGVDNIREIIERSQFAPVQCRYKVYVIDECHMLSVAAFNALLKTLEEPPERVIFVLATTDPQRVLPTIISRCQRFDYRRIPLLSMVSHLRKIADLENININDQAVTLVAQIANGGLRDAESLLDQLSLLSGTVDPEKVWDLVGAVPEQDLLALLEAIASDNAETVLDCCRKLMNRGREPLVVLQNLAGFYLNLLIAKSAPKRPDLVAVTAPTWQHLCAIAPQWDTKVILQGQQQLKESEVQLRNSTQPRLWLEVTLLNLLPSACRTVQTTVQSSISQHQPKAVQSQPVTATPPTATFPPSVTNPPVQNVVNNSLPSPSPVSAPLETEKPETPDLTLEPVPETVIPTRSDASLDEIWQAVLSRLIPTTQSLLRSHGNLILLEENYAQVAIKNESLLKLITDKLAGLEAALKEVCGRTIRVKFIIGTGENPSASKVSQARSPIVSDSISPPPPQPSQTPLPPPNQTPPTPDHNSNEGNSSRPPESNLPTISATSRQINTIQPLNPTISKPTITRQPESTVNTPSVVDQVYSETDLQKAAESLAKVFEGEIIILEDRLNSEDEDDKESVVEETPPSVDSTLEEATLPPVEPTKPLIQGRPSLDNITDDEDIPFLRPVYTKNSLQGEMLDSWEVSLNSYWHGIGQFFSES